MCTGLLWCTVFMSQGGSVIGELCVQRTLPGLFVVFRHRESEGVPPVRTIQGSEFWKVADVVHSGVIQLGWNFY